MSTDFISQASFSAGLELTSDVLYHEELAASLLDKIRLLPPGAVIAVQGSWGRGKTDVLARLAQKSLTGDRPPWLASGAVWLNPWQYGTADLLTPLVLGLLDRIPERRRSSNRSLRKAAESVIRAGANFGLKATALIVPGASLLKEAAGPVDELLKGLFGALDAESIPPPDPDPVAKMAEKFRTLVDELLMATGAAPDGRMLVCVDDLDRCLPDRQVALLEALRFLTSAGARATFLVALDPTLARQAVVARYGTTAFDPDRYLDKMFHLRVNLPALARADVEALAAAHLDRHVPWQETTQRLGDVLEPMLGPANVQVITHATRDALIVQDLRNPRIIERIFQRLYLSARGGVTAKELDLTEYRPDGDTGLRDFILWLGVIERWPEIRVAFQDADESSVGQRLAEINYRYRWWSDEQVSISVPNEVRWASTAVVERLPRREDAPELVQVCRLLLQENYNPVLNQMAFRLGRYDRALVRIGL